MEQRNNVENLTEQTEESSNSPPHRRAKRHSDDNLQHFEATSNNTGTLDVHLIGAEHSSNQQSSNSHDIGNFSLQRMIVLWLLRGILRQTPVA